MAQVESYKTKQQVDGKSFVPMLLGKTTNYNNRSLIWHFPNLWGNDGPGIGTTSAIRKGDFKLVYYYETGKRELFNVTDDIGEARDLASSNPQLVKKLSKELSNRLRKMKAQRPSFKTTGEVCPWPDEVK